MYFGCFDGRVVNARIRAMSEVQIPDQPDLNVVANACGRFKVYTGAD